MGNQSVDKPDVMIGIFFSFLILGFVMGLNIFFYIFQGFTFGAEIFDIGSSTIQLFTILLFLLFNNIFAFIFKNKDMQKGFIVGNLFAFVILFVSQP